MSTTNLTNPHLFLDDRWIADAHRVQRVWHEANWYPEPVLRPTEPWEGHQVILYGTVVRDAGFAGFRMYYITFNPPLPSLVCLAESDDGIQWRKPRLGLYEWGGNRDNNIVFMSACSNDGVSLAHDPGAEYPYLLYYFMYGSRKTTPAYPVGIYVARSKDGLHFDALDTPVLAKCGDRNNVMLNRVNGKLVLVCRDNNMMTDPGSRSIWLAESADGLQFTAPELILARDLLDAPLVEYYGMAAFAYGDLYLGLLEYWQQRPDRIEIVLGWSDDLRRWHLPPGRRPFIPATFPWNENWNSPNSAPPIQVGDQLWFYVGARSGAHSLSSPHSYGCIGLATMRQDRFCSLSADALPGRVVTKPMLWTGGELLVNASTTRYLDSHPAMGGGEMRIEVLDAECRPMDGFAGAEAAVFEGNRPARVSCHNPPVRWGERSLDALRGRTIRLRFAYRDAHLYSFKAARA